MDNKRYYWIKLRTDFFNREEIDFLLSQKNGCKYIVLYQMLCLFTANTNGELCNKLGEVFIPYDINKIVRDTKYFDYDTVAVALEMFKKLGLVYKEENVMKIANFKELVGSESSSAKRVREYRARQKALQCNNNVTQDIEKENKSIEHKDNKNIYCHLHFKEKVESCVNCYKRKLCSLPTSSKFKEKYQCSVEDYEDKISEKPYYIDKNGEEYWHSKKIETNLTTKEEQEELKEYLNELTI